jgi:nitrogen-specific signal transduction histidine kinase
VRENEESIRRIFESAPVAMILVDGTNLEILKLNELAAQLVNSDINSAIGQGFGSLWGAYFRNNPELFDRIKSCARIKCLEAGITIAGCHDGSVLISSNLISYADKPAIIIGLSDISNQKEAENRYRTLHQEFQALLNGLPDGMALLSPDRTVSWVNRAMIDMAGLENTEIIGENCHQILHKFGDPCEVCPVLSCFGSGLPEMRLLHYPVDNTVELRVIPVKDEKGDVLKVIKVLRDVTEQKKLERRLQNAQKLEAVGKLAGGIAHDFNNILTAVIGFASLISMKMEPDTSVRHYADQILSLSDRAAGLTQGLLAFSRNQVMSPKTTNLNSLIRNVQKLLVSLLGVNIEFVLDLSPATLTIMADSVSLEQVLMNLASNAKDAMPDGGKVIIRSEPCSMDDAFVLANGFGKPGQYASISVIDTGVGIDEPTMEKIFEPFFTTKGIGKGTGLGLASVYGSSNSMGDVSGSAAHWGEERPFRSTCR